MATAQYSPDYGTDPNGTNLDYGTSDPRKIASQTRRLSGAQYAQSNDQAQKTQDYLGNIENPLAQGQGGYNAEEKSQIQLTPQQQQNIVTGAGISAGTGTAAAVGGAQRAANAAGGNPLALAAYRARAAQTQGAQAGDAMTQARIGASDAAAQREENIGGARMGQQNQALGYYQGLQGQQNQNAQNAANRGVQGSQLGLTASQTPSTFDKVMGGVSGAVGALGFLDEGGTGGGRPAVVGENGPEKIVDLAGRDYMDEGGTGIPSLYAPHSDDYNAAMSAGPDMGTTTSNPDGSLTFAAPGSSQPKVPFWKRLQAGLQQNHGNVGSGGPGSSLAPLPGQQQRPWSPVDTYSGLGASAGKLAGLLEDGGVGADDYHYARDATTSAPVSQKPAPAPAFQGDLTPMEKWDRAHGTTPTQANSGTGSSDGYRHAHDATTSARPASQKPAPLPAFKGDLTPRDTLNRALGTEPRADGGIGQGSQGANGIFTKPTKVLLNHNDAVVPLGYRARAKVRPSMAALPAAVNSGGRRAYI